MAKHQLDAWFSKRRALPKPSAMKCGMCGGALLHRWRSGRDYIKVSCDRCGRQVDVARNRHWKVRFSKQDPPSERFGKD